MLSNHAQAANGLEVWVKQMEKVAVSTYRERCAGLLKELLYSTPQFSGKAVANWKMGIGAPDMSWDDRQGEKFDILDRKDGTGAYVSFGHIRQMGDKKWIDQAWDDAKLRFRQIKLGDVVFFSNNVHGDTDGGKSDTNYLASLQSQSYWSDKLRLVNMPYQTAAETLLIYNWKSFADAGATGLEDLV